MRRYYKVGVGGDWILILASDSYKAKLKGIDIFDSKLVNVEIALDNEVQEYIHRRGPSRIVTTD